MPETTGSLLDRLDSALREQDGFVTTHQAERLGVRRSKLNALVGSGDLRSVVRSVYVLDKRAPMPRVEERTYAAWLALDGRRFPWEKAEPVVVLSHASAARVHRLGTLPDDVVEMTSATRRTTTFPAIRLHIAPLGADDWEWAMERRIMVTTPARTIADLAISPIERGYVLDALDDAVELRTATRETAIAAVARRSPRRVAMISRLLARAQL
jgi:predicted transcriptional regulator of viral defense system